MSEVKTNKISPVADDSTLTIGDSGDTVTINGLALSANSVDSDQYVDGSIDLVHLQTGTDGELITWDASGNPATVPVGTATHVLTSGGAGVAPTFQAAAGGGGIYTIVTKSTVAATTRELTLATGTYDMGFLIQFANVYPSTAGQLQMFLSDDAGSSWHNSYNWATAGGDHDGAAINDGSGAADAYVNVISNSHRPVNAAAACGWMYIPNAIGGYNQHITWQLGYLENSTNDTSVVSGVSANQTSVINHDMVKFSYSGGGNVNGVLTLYGMKGVA